MTTFAYLLTANNKSQFLKKQQTLGSVSIQFPNLFQYYQIFLKHSRFLCPRDRFHLFPQNHQLRTLLLCTVTWSLLHKSSNFYFHLFFWACILFTRRRTYMFHRRLVLVSVMLNQRIKKLSSKTFHQNILESFFIS